eukprot:SAG31_NODE_47664_length_229_cov_8.446154_1_plen_39_part_10
MLQRVAEEVLLRRPVQHTVGLRPGSLAVDPSRATFGAWV